MFAGAFTKGKSAAIQTFGTDAQKVLVQLLFEDRIQIISTFDMNKVASLTYCDTTEDEIFDVFRETLARPTDYTVLTLQKTLLTVRHVVIYGAEDCISDACALARAVDDLRRYNTVLIAQQNPNSALGFWHKIKGGGVDEGHPVREAAERLYSLLCSREKIRQIRTMSEDPNSIVPVGSRKDAAYMSDEARFKYLQRRMQIEQGQITKSNLAKGDNSFGAGYSAAKGGSVVGAAHGIEEMIKAAEREKKRFVDAPSERDQERAYVPKLEDFADVLPAEQQKKAADAGGMVPDLLGTLDDIPTSAGSAVDAGPVDLLGAINAPVAAPVDLLGGDDLLGMSSGGGGSATSASADLLSMGAPAGDIFSAGPSTSVPAADQHDPFAPVQSTTEGSSEPDMAPSVAALPAGNEAINNGAVLMDDAKQTKRSIMGGSTSQQAISALDELAALSLGNGSEEGPPPLPSAMPPPPPPGNAMPADLPSEMPPPIPNEPPPARPSEMPPPPPPMGKDSGEGNIPDLPPPELMPPAPPPVLDIKDDDLAAEFGGAMGGTGETWAPPPVPNEPPPPPPPPDMGMGMGGAMGGAAAMGGQANGMMDMSAMMQAVQSGALSPEDQAKLMQQMMLQNQMMMNMMMNQGGGAPQPPPM